MPLIKSPSPHAVGENIKREVAAGKPRAQSIAIALSEQRRAKARAKMWKGGEAEREPEPDLTIDAGVPYSDTDFEDFDDPDETSETSDTLGKALLRRRRKGA